MAASSKLQASNLRWRYRRRLAVQSFWIMAAITIGIFVVPVERLSGIIPILTIIYPSYSAIVMAYIGFATWDEKK